MTDVTNANDTASVIAPKIVVVKVKFKDGLVPRQHTDKTYQYYTRETFKPGDKAVVVSPCDDLTIVTIEEVMDVACLASKWIICKIPMDEYNARKVAQEKIATMSTLLQRKAKQVQEQKSLEDVLSGDPEAMAMLATLKELQQQLL